MRFQSEADPTKGFETVANQTQYLPARRGWRAMYVVPFDLSGSPALVLPAGVNKVGGPVAVQFVAQRFREDVLLQVGYAFEQATQWHLRRPRLESTLAHLHPCLRGFSGVNIGADRYEELPASAGLTGWSVGGVLACRDRTGAASGGVGVRVGNQESLTRLRITLFAAGSRACT